MLKKLLLPLLLAACVAHAQNAPFTPTPGQDTSSLAVTATAQNITVPATSITGPIRSAVFSNVGTQTVFFRCDGTTATASGAGLGMPVAAGQAYKTGIPYSATACSVIAAATGSTLYVTWGNN